MSLEKHNKHLVNDLLYSMETSMEHAIMELIVPNVNLSDIADEQEKKIIESIKEVADGKKIDERDHNKLSSSFLKQEKTFNSKLSCIQRHKNFLEPAEKEKWVQLFPILQQNILHIRNESFHNRPITDEFFSKIINFCHERVLENNKIFNNLKDDLRNYDIYFEEDEKNTILINFPHPDYHWHKFVGRDEIYNRIKKFLFAGRSILNIYGPGGYGKSALVDYLARQLAEEKKYEKIIWYSDKDEWWDLEKNKSVSSNAKNSVELFKKNPIAGDSRTLAEIVMENQCLIIVDNLDTMIDEGIELIEEYASPNAQFITTSRIMTETGTQQRLDGLKTEESIDLIKNINKFKFIEEIDNLEKEQLEEIVTKLNNSPLHIKWYIESVDRGSSAQNIPNDHSKITEFCFSGLLEALDTKERELLNIYNIFQKPVGNLDISHVSSLPLDEIDSTSIKLNRHGFIKRDSSRDGYKLYILNNDIRPLLVDKELSDLKDTLKIQKQIKEMNKRISRVRENHSRGNFNFSDLKGYEIANNSDAFICWRLEEIDYNFNREKKNDLTEAHKNQIKRFEDLMQIIPNNPQVLIGASTAYNFDGQLVRSNELISKALKFSESDFLKKRCLFFYCRICDKTNEFSNGLTAAKELWELDKSIESLDLLIQMLIGTQQGKLALEELDGVSQNEIDEIDEGSANKFIMLFIKILRSCIYAGNLVNNDFTQIYGITKKLIPLSGRYIDKLALGAFLRLVMSFENKYSQYINISLQERLLSSQELIEALIKESKNNNRLAVVEILEKVNLEDTEIMGSIMSEIEINSRHAPKTSEIFKESKKNHTSFYGEISRKWLLHGIDRGYMVKAEDGAEACLAYRDANFGVQIGDTDDFICTHISGNFVYVKTKDHKENPINAEMEKKIWEQLNVGENLECVVKNIVDYGAFVFIKKTPQLQALIHRKDLTWGYCPTGEVKKFLDVGQEIKAQIIEIKLEERKMSMSIKALQSPPDTKFLVGEKFNGEIVEIWGNGNGCIIKSDEGNFGSLHISKFLKLKDVSSLSKGMKMKTKIISIDRTTLMPSLKEI